MITYSSLRDLLESVIASLSSPRTTAQISVVRSAEDADASVVSEAPSGDSPRAETPPRDIAPRAEAVREATNGGAALPAATEAPTATAAPIAAALADTIDAPPRIASPAPVIPTPEDGPQDAALAFDAPLNVALMPDASLSAECNFIAGDPPRAPGRVFYVDSVNGSDANSGLSGGSAFKSLAKVQELLADGDTIQLKCGSIWHEQLRFTEADVTVQSYGTGANPLISGDGLRHGIVVQGENALIRNIDVTDAPNGIYVTGEGASATIIGGTYAENGTGIVAGGGGQLLLVDGAHCTGSRTEIGAGDGIQISADASAGAHLIRNVVCDANDIAGINAKAGTVTVSDSTLSFNGEPGWIAQNNVDVFNILRSRIEGNNQSDNGTGQASVEDAAIVYSTGNLYLDAHNGQYATVQINIVPSGGWSPEGLPDRPIALHSEGDTFINAHGQTNTIGSIRVHTDGTPAIVSISNGLFEHAAGSGIAVNAYGATALTLAIESSEFRMTDTLAVLADEGTEFGPGLATNLFSRADGGAVVLIGASTSYTQAEIENLFALHESGGLAPEFAADPIPFAIDAPIADTGFALDTLHAADYLFA